MLDTRRTVWLLAVGALALAAVAGSTACTKTEAAPLEVTYYYLPG